MVTNSPTFFNLDESYVPGHRQGRRRWVPKGVMLLVFLFMLGLLNACTTDALPKYGSEPIMSEIALPAEQAQIMMS